MIFLLLIYLFLYLIILGVSLINTHSVTFPSIFYYTESCSIVLQIILSVIVPNMLFCYFSCPLPVQHVPLFSSTYLGKSYNLFVIISHTFSAIRIFTIRTSLKVFQIYLSFCSFHNLLHTFFIFYFLANFFLQLPLFFRAIFY
jgi:hypothetical protein